ncbi:hypothetical protein FH972_022223 [Carpinus fangiana]|uniref:DNA repair protein rad9 n=1 Tax=Carpinus fangiana TaxID=176857 RepID=A0A5N6KRY8_9ROSI|nr:hypothetical protein FH972_022223 [Carpinus fangiana]
MWNCYRVSSVELFESSSANQYRFHCQEMTLLDFTLSPASAARLHDALICLAKFSEYVSLEARAQVLVLSALNASKSAYAAFFLDETIFFEDYHFVPDPNRREPNFSCQILNKLVDSKGGTSTLEKCEVDLQDAPDKTESRINVKMVCAQAVDSMHALFDQKRAKNHWRIQSSWLKEYMDYFGPKTEQLDLCSENGRLTLTSYTEKIMNGKAVSIDLTDFEEINVQEELHIAMNVKDFRNMVLHADTLRASVTALYTEAGRPLQFSYKMEGLRCEFTLMTIGDYRPGSTPAVSRAATREPNGRAASVTSASLHRDALNMPPPARRSAAQAPARSASQLGSRTNGSAIQAPLNQESDSLFIPEQDNDAQWAPAEEDDDSQMDPQSFGTFRDSRPSIQTGDSAGSIGRSDQGIEPTQRASQVRGIFDD